MYTMPRRVNFILERKKEQLNQEARGKRQLQDIICGGSRYFLLRCWRTFPLNLWIIWSQGSFPADDFILLSVKA